MAVMEWVQQHPFLYDKSNEDFSNNSNKEPKKQLYREKANELGIEGAGDETGQRLQTWVKTQRDKVGRVVKMVKGASGSEAVQFIAENSRFL